MTRDAINMNKVVLPNGVAASIHGRINERRTLLATGVEYTSSGYVFVHGHRV